MIKKNIRVNIYIAVCVILIIVMTQQPVSALPGLQSDLSYTFTNQTQTEFYNTNTTQQYNISEGMPGYVFDIIGSEPYTVYNSDFGTNIILPGGSFDPQPANNRPAQAPSSSPSTGINGAPSNSSAPGSANTSSGGNSSSSPYTSSHTGNADYPGFSFEENVTAVRVTPVAQVRRSDGSVGTLSIPKIGLNITVYDGDIREAMLKGAGHIASTSAWLGNVGITGHNRGVVNNFGKLKELAAGDIIQYATALGTKQYKVNFAGRVSETDWSRLQRTSDNRITLVTCIEDVPSQRLLVQGIEITN